MRRPVTCTVVTCFYRFPSKHSAGEYDAWTARFLGAVDTPMVAFCDADMAPRLSELRARVASQTRVVVLPLSAIDGGWNDVVDWDDEHARDPERGAQAHSPSLYKVWNAKSALVGRAMAMDPFGSEAYAWCDIGCFRSDLRIESYRRWPEGARLDAADPERVVLLRLQPFQPRELALDPATGLPPSFAGVNRIGGTVMVGHRRAWERWIPAYYATMRRMVAAGVYVGTDQHVMATVAATRPDLVALVAPTYLREHGDPWFFLHPWFAV